jgi:hypothetical protein
VDHYRVVKDFTARGATVKDFLEDCHSGRRFIAKLGRRHSDLEVMNEYAIYLVGRTLGVRLAGAKIRTYKGRLRFLSEYFLKADGSEELVHGVQLFSQLYDEATVNAVLGNEASEQAFFTVQAVKAAFGAHYLEYGAETEERLFEGFVAMLTHDALIGVQDRHHENWGVIVQRGRNAPPPRFAPLYDSARGLFGNARDEHLGRYLGPTAGSDIDAYISRSRPLIGFEGLRPANGRTHISHAALLAAVYAGYPQIQPLIASILAAFDPRRVLTELKRLEPLCSSRRRTLMLKCLKRRHILLARALQESLKKEPRGADTPSRRNR